jgi:hypothetical protein
VALSARQKLKPGSSERTSATVTYAAPWLESTLPLRFGYFLLIPSSWNDEFDSHQPAR